MSSLGQGYSSGLSVTSREEQEYEPLLPQELTEEKASQEEEEAPRGRALTKRPRSVLDTGISEPDWEQFQTALEIDPEPEEAERAEFTRIETENRALQRQREDIEEKIREARVELENEKICEELSSRRK